MLEQIIQWVAAGDKAIIDMGPIVSIAIAMLAASCFTQVAKFPLSSLITTPARFDWTTKVIAIVVTFIAIRLLTTKLPLPVVLVFAWLQPVVYTLTMRVVRHRWPWLEATKLVGSAAPSPEATQLYQARRDARG